MDFFVIGHKCSIFRLCKFLVCVTLLSVCFLINAQAEIKVNNFIAPGGREAAYGLNNLGFGFYLQPVKYRYKDGSQPELPINYRGWLINYTRYFESNLATRFFYIQADEAVQLTAYGASLLYGFNLNRPGLGFYVGVAYTQQKIETWKSGATLPSASDRNWDYPIGLQVQLREMILNLETRYKHFLVNDKNISVNQSRYPLYVSLMFPF